MSKEPVNQSAYSDYLYHQIEKWFASGRVAFTLQELAEFCHIKVTGNMRRRVNHCVAKGTLSMTPAYLSKHGRCNVYYKPLEDQMGDLPF